MPVLIQSLQQVPVLDLSVAAGAALLLPLGLHGEHRHACKANTALPSEHGLGANTAAAAAITRSSQSKEAHVHGADSQRNPNFICCPRLTGSPTLAAIFS